jgi:hypothetical protein
MFMDDPAQKRNPPNPIGPQNPPDGSIPYPDNN